MLVTGDAKGLISLPSAQRRHAMEGLSALSKYTGCYDTWENIREKYQLRWANSEQENLKFFINYMTGKGNFDEMVKWLRNVVTKLPNDAANVLVFNTLTGLRPKPVYFNEATFSTEANFAGATFSKGAGFRIYMYI